jgi:hypothetical protein
MNAPTPAQGVLLIDGAQFADAHAWLYQHYAQDSPRALLKGTPYEPIAGSGPFVLNASQGSAAFNAWWSGSNLQRGVWLSTSRNLVELVPILRRRLRIFDEQGDEFWLRLADGHALARSWLTEAQWPAGFWFGIESVWLRHAGRAVCAWTNDHPEHDAAPADLDMTAQFTLSTRLLDALSQSAQEPKA